MPIFAGALTRPEPRSYGPEEWRTAVLAALTASSDATLPAADPWLLLTAVGLDRAALVDADRQVGELWTLLGLGAGDRVLDLGCGVGRHLRPFVERGAVVAGVDLSPGVVAVARATLPEADITCGPFDTDTGRSDFSVVLLMSRTLSLLGTAGAAIDALRAAKRALSSRGSVIVEVASRPDPEGTVTWPRRTCHRVTERCTTLAPASAEGPHVLHAFEIRDGASTNTWSLPELVPEKRLLERMAAAAGLRMEGWADISGDTDLRTAILRPSGKWVVR